MKGVDIYSKNIAILVLSCFVVLFFVLSVAGMNVRYNTTISNSSYVIAIDSSASMTANDVYPSRIEFAKNVADTFVNDAPMGTRIGVISFSSVPVIEQSMTQDKILLKQSIGGVNVTYLGGDDFYAAVITAANMLSNESSKAIVLISDGQDNAGGISYAIDYANKNSIAINTIAVGTLAGGNTTYGYSQVNVDTLKSLSFNTQGNFSSANSSAEVNQYVNNIMGLKYGAATVDLSKDLFVIALMLFVLDYILIHTKFRIFP